MKRDCPERSGGGGGAGGRSASATCDHCRQPGHTKDRCFDLHPELRSRGRSQGGRASSGVAEGRGATAVAPLPATIATMVARIEELE